MFGKRKDVVIDLRLFSLVFQLRWEESIVVFVTFHRKRWSYRKCTYMQDSMHDGGESICLRPRWPGFVFFNAILEFLDSMPFLSLLVFYLTVNLWFFLFKKKSSIFRSPSAPDSIIRYTVLLREECRIWMKSRSPSFSYKPSRNILKMLRIQPCPTKK